MMALPTSNIAPCRITATVKNRVNLFATTKLVFEKFVVTSNNPTTPAPTTATRTFTNILFGLIAAHAASRIETSASRRLIQLNSPLYAPEAVPPGVVVAVGVVGFVDSVGVIVAVAVGVGVAVGFNVGFGVTVGFTVGFTVGVTPPPATQASPFHSYPSGYPSS